MNKKSKHYYEYDRNIDNAKQNSTWQNEVIKDKDNKWSGGTLDTATTYILRAYRKHDTPVDCIKKAIAHLEFELEKIKQK